MDKQVKEYSLGDYFAVLLRRRWQFIIPAFLILAAVVVYAKRLPAIFYSQATILIEQQEIPQELVRSTVTSYADQRIQTISQRVMTTSNLSKVIEEYGLYSEAGKNATMASLVNKLRSDISLDIVSADVMDPRSGRTSRATIAFSLGYESQSPKTATRITNEIVSLFLNENLKKRREVAKQATEFLAEETQKLSGQIADLESQLSVLKKEHGGSLPEMRDLNVSKLERLEGQLRDNSAKLSALDERVIYLDSEIAQINPYSNFISTTGERIMSAVDRLKALEAEYLMVASRYTGSHPDRIKMEREIAALKKSVGGTGSGNFLQKKRTALEAELSVLRDKYSPSHPDVKRVQKELSIVKQQIAKAKIVDVPEKQDVKGDNPAYVQLRARLQAARTEKSSLKEVREEILSEIKKVENALTKGPEIERDYLQLTRQYETARAEYDQVRAKARSAELAESLESESKAERFVLIEPPFVPEVPIKPNRMAIVLFGVILSFAGGFTHVALREGLDQRLYGGEMIEAITDQAPIATIPYMTTEDDLVKKRIRLAAVFVVVAAVLAGTLLAFHVYFRPLDVFYYQTLQKAGL